MHASACMVGDGKPTSNGSIPMMIGAPSLRQSTGCQVSVPNGIGFWMVILLAYGTLGGSSSLVPYNGKVA